MLRARKSLYNMSISFRRWIQIELTHLIWCIRNADIKVWKIHLHDISEQNIKALRFRLALYSFRDFSSHSWIKLYCYDFLCFFENLYSQIPCTRADFKYNLSAISLD